MRNIASILGVLLLGAVVGPASDTRGQAPAPAAETAPEEPTAAAAAAAAAEAAEAAEAEAAADETVLPLRLFEQEPPYDEITLRESGKTVRVIRLPFRAMPANSLPTDNWDIALIVDPDKVYELTRKDVAAVKFWEQIVLEAANQLVADKNFDEAYDFFDYMLQNFPAAPGVEEGYQQFVFKDATEVWLEGRADYALAMFAEVHARNPAYPRLDTALGKVVDKIVEGHYEREEFAPARRLLRKLAGMYPNHVVAVKWQGKLAADAGVLLAAATEHRQAARLPEAYTASLRAYKIWPGDQANRELLTRLQEEYPRVVVGVRLPRGTSPTDRLDDWASRRSRRLMGRGLQEFIGHGPQGGEYLSPFGRLTRLDLDLKLLLNLNPGMHWSDDALLTGYDVAQHLRDMADPDSPHFRSDWQSVFARAQVHGVMEVEVDLRRGHVRPEALLQESFETWRPAARAVETPPTLGPYRLGAQTTDAVQFLANDRYFARGPYQPREVLEAYFPDARAAVTALRRGDVTILDRLNPWEVKPLRAAAGSDIVVEEYAVPTIHCLVPNPDRPLAASRHMRRALVFGIDRDLLLREQLFQGAPPPGSRVISGPFPAGLSADDALGYAYNDAVPVLPYDPTLALLRRDLTLAEYNKRHEGEGEPLKELPPILLAHAPHEMARLACRAIQQHLKIVKIEIQLVELPSDRAAAPPEYDFLYAEVAMWEPVIDARRLLGSEGLARRCSSYMDQALRRLDEADDWKAVRERLLEVHRMCDMEMAIVPLYQLTEHFAYHQSVAGIAARPVSLYQSIETWRLVPPPLEEGE